VGSGGGAPAEVKIGASQPKHITVHLVATMIFLRIEFKYQLDVTPRPVRVDTPLIRRLI